MIAAPICYLEIPAPNLDSAATFYSSVFGWTMQRSGDYMIFGTGEKEMQGGLDPSKPVAEGGVLLYLKVDDIPARLQAIEKTGGTVVQAKRPVGTDPAWGFYGIFKDPNGNSIGVWAKS